MLEIDCLSLKQHHFITSIILFVVFLKYLPYYSQKYEFNFDLFHYGSFSKIDIGPRATIGDNMVFIKSMSSDLNYDKY